MNKENKYNIYVLSLENNKYYIGKTTGDLDDCIKTHMKKPIPWLALNKPIEIIESFKSAPIEIEEEFTIKYIKLYGIDNVRNSNYSDFILDPIIMKKWNQDIINNDINIDINYIKSQLNSIDNNQKIKILFEEINRLENLLKLIDQLNKSIYRNSIVSYSARNINEYYTKYVSIHTIMNNTMNNCSQKSKDNSYIIDLISKYIEMKRNNDHFYKIDHTHKKILDNIDNRINHNNNEHKSKYEKSIYIKLLKILNNDIEYRNDLYNLIKTECSEYNYNIPLVENIVLIDLDKVYTDSLLYLIVNNLYDIIIKKNEYFLQEIYKLNLINKNAENQNLPPPPYKK
jgi:hypothetical protein